MQEEAEPGALAASCRPDAVHAVVPVAAADERQAVGAGGEALVDRANAMFEERAVLGGHARLAVRLVLVRREQRRLEERHALVQHADVAGRADVLAPPTYGSHSRSSEQRDAGRGRSARATSAGRRLRRTAGRRRAADARWRARAAPAATPSRPAVDRGSRRRRPAGSSRRASRAGSSCPDRAATGSSARRTNRPACGPGSCRASRSTAPARARARRPSRRPCRDGAISCARAPRRCPGRAETRSGASRPAAGRSDLQRRARIEPGAECPRASHAPSAAGRESRPLRPMNDRRSPVTRRAARSRARTRRARELLAVGVAREDRAGRPVEGQQYVIGTKGRRKNQSPTSSSRHNRSTGVEVTNGLSPPSMSTASTPPPAHEARRAEIIAARTQRRPRRGRVHDRCHFPPWSGPWRARACSARVRQPLSLPSVHLSAVPTIPALSECKFVRRQRDSWAENWQ